MGRATQFMRGWVLALLAASGPALGDNHNNFSRLYGELLQRYWHEPVIINGIRTTVFDYQAMATDAGADESLFERTRSALAKVEPDQLDDPDQAKAFWINAYNFGAMALVIDAYPVDSIRSFKISLFRHPWSQEAVRIQDKAYSLAEIEHDILLKRYDDPRIVFGVSCAAVSCPDRQPEPFRGETLDAQLDATIRRFYENPGKGLRLDRDDGVVYLSWILKKDQDLFAERPDGVMGFVRRYAPPATTQWLDEHDPEIRYLDHDWTLNDLAQAKG